MITMTTRNAPAAAGWVILLAVAGGCSDDGDSPSACVVPTPVPASASCLTAPRLGPSAPAELASIPAHLRNSVIEAYNIANDTDGGQSLTDSCMNCHWATGVDGSFVWLDAMSNLYRLH